MAHSKTEKRANASATCVETNNSQLEVALLEIMLAFKIDYIRIQNSFFKVSAHADVVRALFSFANRRRP